MGRRKKSIVDKSPFKLRKRQLEDGRVSLFIDCIVEGKHKYEFLKLYLLPETSEKIRRENVRTMRTAEDIIRSRTESLIVQKADEVAPKDLSQTLVAEFIDVYAEDYKRNHNREDKQMTTLRGLLQLFKKDARLSDIDKKFCVDFSDWLKHTYVKRDGNHLARQTVFGYFWQFSILLSNAKRMGYIDVNPWCYLESNEKIRKPEIEQRFLTLDEIHILETTPCSRELVKQAFLFSCFCGLRISDVLKIRWKDIFSDNGIWYASVIMKKTSKPVSIPLPDKALAWLPKRVGDDAKVFDGLPNQSNITKHLKRWCKEAGITGRIHFHVSRHTYGTMLMTAGVELYTASKLMGHSDVRATQVYAKIIDKKKQEAVSLIDNVF